MIARHQKSVCEYIGYIRPFSEGEFDDENNGGQDAEVYRKSDQENT